MSFPLVSRWKQDTALNSYIFCLFLIGLPFTIFSTYVIYQLQAVGYIIGTDSEGLPCTTYCLVPFGTRRLDLNSVVLYLNAMGLGLGGALALLISAYADFWKNKGLLVAFFIVVYGAIAVPAYWLKGYTLTAFNSLAALFVLYAVVTYILVVLLNIYIPHCMRISQEKDLVSLSTLQQEMGAENHSTTIDRPGTPTTDKNMSKNEARARSPTRPRKYGFKMSIMGAIGTAAAGILTLILVIMLSQTLPGTEGQSAGLLITTVVGFITIVGSIVAVIGLPTIPAKSHGDWKSWWFHFFAPLKDLLERKNMMFLLLSYTIYSDTVFALNSVTAQLYYIEVMPDTLEYSLYSMAGVIFQLVCTLGFYLLQIWRPPFRLENWLIIGYALILIVPIWGCIGLAGNIDFGFKNCWEFYVQSLIFYLSGSIVNPVFRVLFSELVPTGSEIEWFGLQVVLSCATAWVSYVANAPLQNATHELRFPLVLCLVFLAIPVVLECCRCTLKVFSKGKLRSQEHDNSTRGLGS